ncbi:hypothetical protein Tco_0813300 [Tanacetum coccineum]
MFPLLLRQLKLLEFEKFTHLALLFLFAFSRYKELSEIARLALVDENWLRLWASALYSSDSRVRVCSLLTRDALKNSNLEIIGLQLGLESLEARIVVHQKNEAVCEEDIAFLKYNVKVRDNFITELKNKLAEDLREKDNLKLKLENQINENELHDCHLNKSKVFESASDNSVNEIEEENNQVNDRFKKVEGYHAVPPPYSRNYMPCIDPSYMFNQITI